MNKTAYALFVFSLVAFAGAPRHVAAEENVQEVLEETDENDSDPSAFEGDSESMPGERAPESMPMDDAPGVVGMGFE